MDVQSANQKLLKINHIIWLFHKHCLRDASLQYEHRSDVEQICNTSTRFWQDWKEISFL
jgi:hypothetical protein